MNATRSIATFVILTATGSTFAQEYVQPDSGFASSKSRIEILAEINQARQNSTLQIVDSRYPVLKFAPSKSRSEVQVEVAQARAAGTLQVLDHQYPLAQYSGEGKTREEIRAELAAAIANRTIERIAN